MGLSDSGATRVLIDPKYFRPTEVPYLLGDASKARKILNWIPTYNIDALIEDMINSELNHHS